MTYKLYVEFKGVTYVDVEADSFEEAKEKTEQDVYVGSTIDGTVGLYSKFGDVKFGDTEESEDFEVGEA